MRTCIITNPHAGSAAPGAALREAVAGRHDTIINGVVRVVPDLTGYETAIAWEDGPAERVEALNVVVGGIPVAPAANPEDGWLDVVVVRYGSVVELAGVAARLFAGNYLTSEQVLHRRVRRVRVISRPGMWCNIDGEILTKEPITFTVQPQALRVVVGPAYTPTPVA